MCRRIGIAPRLLSLALGLSLISVEASAWEEPNEILKLTSSSSSLSIFGHAVAVSGNTMVVGAPGDEAAYVYDAATGQQLHKLTASGANPGVFGISVGVCGNTIIIGAYLERGAVTDEGAAYLFDATTGQQLFKLKASNATTSDQFGYSVAISESFALVGAAMDDEGGYNSGSAYVFDLATGQELRRITLPVSADHDWFGFSVALSGTKGLISARNEDEHATNSGAAYVFDVTTGQQLLRLTASDAGQQDRFGESVAIDGNLGIVGTDIYEETAYVFDMTTGQELFKLTGSGAFGKRVAVEGNLALVGASLDGELGIGAGAVYLFDLTSGQQVSKLTASDGGPSDGFGTAVAISGEKILIGSPWDVPNGSAYLFDLYTKPAIDAITPDRGPSRGGNTITIHGSSFWPGTTVSIDGQLAQVTSLSYAQLQVVVPRYTGPPPTGVTIRRLAADVDVTVTTPYGNDTVINGYMYRFVGW